MGTVFIGAIEGREGRPMFLQAGQTCKYMYVPNIRASDSDGTVPKRTDMALHALLCLLRSIFSKFSKSCDEVPLAARLLLFLLDRFSSDSSVSVESERSLKWLATSLWSSSSTALRHFFLLLLLLVGFFPTSPSFFLSTIPPPLPKLSDWTFINDYMRLLLRSINQAIEKRCPLSSLLCFCMRYHFERNPLLLARERGGDVASAARPKTACVGIGRGNLRFCGPAIHRGK
jgi:hypothetical protein